MLRLEKMELRGFKSFGDPTEVFFREGITAVVGPNGCGKSNIGDALNWVLGEQSAKSLRGQQMSDVIFDGTADRKPLGLAEVSLIFGGADGLKQADQGRIVLTRRLYRSGDSEYLLNGSRARLKDFQEMLREARVGARTYATIEQGKIEQVLNAKPKDRRSLIEDAAGVSGYKHKRRLAELKLEACYANLLRVNDIVVEVQRQINSLKRQAAKARRYRKLRDELRAKELVRFTRQAHQLDAELTRYREAESRLRDSEAQASASSSRLESTLLEQRERLERAGSDFREASERRHQLEIEIDRNESQVRSSSERIEEALARAARSAEEAAKLETRHGEANERREACRGQRERGAAELERVNGELSRMQARLEEAEQIRQRTRDEIEELRRKQFESVGRASELRNRQRSAVEALERSSARAERLKQERVEAQRAADQKKTQTDHLSGESESLSDTLKRRRERQAELEARLARLREQHGADLEALAEAREREKSSQARLATLEALDTRFAGVADGVRRLLASAVSQQIRAYGVVADYVEASRDVEGAAEGYLQALLPAVIVEADADAQRAAEFLRAEGGGRVSMISRSQPTGALAVGSAHNGSSALPQALFEDRRVLGRLRDRLTLQAASNGVLADRIGDAVLVDSLASALELHRSYPQADYLTRDGEIVYASGVISAGSRQEGNEGLLAHRRRVEESTLEAVTLAAETAAAKSRVEQGRADLVRLENDASEHKQALEAADRHAVEVRLRAEQSAEEMARSVRQSQVLEDELAGLQAEAQGLRAAIAELSDECRLAESDHASTQRELEERGRALDGQEEQLKALAEELARLREEQAVQRQRQEAVEAESRRLSDEAAELQSRLEAITTDADLARSGAERASELRTRTEAELIAQLEERKRLTAEIQRMEEEITEWRARLAGQEDELRSRRSELESLREQTREAELRRTRSESAREHLDDLCLQELGISVSDALASNAEAGEGGSEPGVEDEFDLELLEREIGEIKGKIERIGPVNMTAIEEFSELDERHAFLTAQREDLEQSMESLKESIRRINRQSRERFLEAFESVRRSFQEIYRLLFSGGRADLRLEEGEDVLECGIEILAQPPGKRLAGVHLLSGGEKALSAIALLFAIFRYQPSPFCLLDEVDAALDDANVGRFTHMLGEYAKNTQFVLITHNKMSMESASVLYGVTMEEPGVSKIVSMQFQ
jgi:chromosome segregation protein